MAGTNVAAGYGGVIKSGSGTLIVTGVNTTQGIAKILAGTLQIGDGGTAGSLGNTAGVMDDGTLAFDRSDTVLASAIQGSGSVVPGWFRHAYHGHQQ